MGRNKLEYKRDQLMDDERYLIEKLFPLGEIDSRGKHYAVIYESEGPGIDAAVIVGEYIYPEEAVRYESPQLRIVVTSACSDKEDMHTVLRQTFVLQNGELLSRSIVGMRTWEEGRNLRDGFQQLKYEDPFTQEEEVNSLSELLVGLAEQQGLEKPQRKVLEMGSQRASSSFRAR